MSLTHVLDQLTTLEILSFRDMLIHRKTHNGILHVIIDRSNSPGNKLKSQQQFRELTENKAPMIKMDLEDDSAQTVPSRH